MDFMQLISRVLVFYKFIHKTRRTIFRRILPCFQPIRNCCHAKMSKISGVSGYFSLQSPAKNWPYTNFATFIPIAAKCGWTTFLLGRFYPKGLVFTHTKGSEIEMFTHERITNFFFRGTAVFVPKKIFILTKIVPLRWLVQLVFIFI